MLSGPPVHGAMALRTSGLGLVVTLIAAAAHATHGHPPSWVLLLVTAMMVAVACLPACRTRLSWTRALVTMAVGQFVLHAWFAWFALPTSGEGAPTLAMHHGPAASTLVSRDFSGMLPSPGMALAHLAAAGLLALLLVNADWLLSAAAAIFGGTLGSRTVVCATFVCTTPLAIFDSPGAPRALAGLTHELVRRGPPAYCA